MPKNGNTNLYRSVRVASLGSRRRGKHHDLTEGILRELKMLKEGMALEIPLAKVEGVEIANLRSAIHRAAEAVSVNIQTQSDEKNLYVWVTPDLTPVVGAEKKSV